MKFATPLLEGRLIQRYKRFFADVELAGGEVVTAAVANTGAMLGLKTPGARVWLSRADDPKRKLKFDWQLVEVTLAGRALLAGVNTAWPNRLVEEAILAGAVPALAGYATLRREVRYGLNSRIDLLLEDAGRPPCYVEVKNVHLMRAPGLAEFPDCVTSRGAKHLAEMSDQVAAGARAVMVYLIQHEGAERFRLARDLDPAYGAAFDKARAAGVEAIALATTISPDGVAASHAVPIDERGEP